MPLFHWKPTPASDVFHLITDFARWARGIWVASIAIVERRADLNTTVEYGILNYRTGALDDGTDPCGRYD